MDHISMIKETGPTCGFQYDHLMAAIGHLYKALELLTGVNNAIVSQSLNFLELVEDLAAGWLEVNRCRIYTENILFYDELLIPALGLINDARLMLESLVHWKLGLTLQAKYNILRCLKEAIMEGIGPCLAELEACLALPRAAEDGV